MDKALASGAGDSGFESQRGRIFINAKFVYPFFLSYYVVACINVLKKKPCLYEKRIFLYSCATMQYKKVPSCYSFILPLEIFPSGGKTTGGKTTDRTVKIRSVKFYRPITELKRPTNQALSN